MTHRAPRAPAARPTWARACAAALLALAGVLSGCASLGFAPDAEPANQGPVAAAQGQDAQVGGAPVVKVEIDAPGELKDLLERHLDLSRLARLTRGDAVTDTELSRLIDAAPNQVRELLQTEGYFKPESTVQRRPATLPGQAETVRLRVDPGERARISRVTIEFEGELGSAGDPRAQSTIGSLRADWALPGGSEFRNAAWNDAKAALLGRLRSVLDHDGCRRRHAWRGGGRGWRRR